MSGVFLTAVKSLLCGSHGTRAVARQVCVDHYYACADIAFACLFCAGYDTCACVYVRAGRCAGELEPHISALWFSCCACCCRCTMSSESHRASSSLLCGSHGTTAVAQQVCVDHFCVSTLHIGVCDVCAVIRTHVACAPAVMFKVTVTLVVRQQRLSTTIYRWGNVSVDGNCRPQ